MLGTRILLEQSTLLVPISATGDRNSRSSSSRLDATPVATRYRKTTWAAATGLALGDGGQGRVRVVVCCVLHANLRVTESVVVSESPAPSPTLLPPRVKASFRLEAWIAAAEARSQGREGKNKNVFSSIDHSAAGIESVLDGDVASDGSVAFLCNLTSGQRAVVVLFCGDVESAESDHGDFPFAIATVDPTTFSLHWASLLGTSHLVTVKPQGITSFPVTAFVGLQGEPLQPNEGRHRKTC